MTLPAEAPLAHLRSGVNNMSETYDVVIVGGGISGGALATVLARRGIAVAVTRAR